MPCLVSSRSATPSSRSVVSEKSRSWMYPVVGLIMNADGTLGETAGLRTGQSALALFAMPAELPPLVHQCEVRNADGTNFKLLKEQFSIDAYLVWAPCDQSHSPFQPFYVLRQPPFVAYARVVSGEFDRGMIVTHAHEDHIGAVPFLLADLNIPVYSSPLTLAMVSRRLDEHEHERD